MLFFYFKNKLNSLILYALRKLSRKYFYNIEIYTEKKALEYPTVILINAIEKRDILSIAHLDQIFDLQESLYIPLISKKLFIQNRKISKRLYSLFKLLGLRIHFGAIVDSFLMDGAFFSEIFKEKKIIIFLGREFNLGEEKFEQISKIGKNLTSFIPSVNFLQLTLTYDYLISKNATLHITESGQLRFEPNEKLKTIASTIRLRRSLNTILTPGNLFSFALFSGEFKIGISRNFLFYKMSRFANLVYKEKICRVNRQCLEVSYDDLFSEMIFGAEQNGFISYNKNSKQYFGSDKLYAYSKNKKYSHESLLRENIYRFHFYQLFMFHRKFTKIWNEIEVYL
jgi:hypothetical protein